MKIKGIKFLFYLLSIMGCILMIGALIIGFKLDIFGTASHVANYKIYLFCSYIVMIVIYIVFYIKFTLKYDNILMAQQKEAGGKKKEQERPRGQRS